VHSDSRLPPAWRWRTAAEGRHQPQWQRLRPTRYRCALVWWRPEAAPRSASGSPRASSHELGKCRCLRIGIGDHQRAAIPEALSGLGRCTGTSFAIDTRSGGANRRRPFARRCGEAPGARLLGGGMRACPFPRRTPHWWWRPLGIIRLTASLACRSDGRRFQHNPSHSLSPTLSVREHLVRTASETGCRPGDTARFRGTHSMST
jgi:hypothetical protein